MPDVPLTDLTTLQAALPPHIRVVHPPHTNQGELLDAEQPTLFIPSHGEPLTGADVTERLRDAVLAG